jgi:hypothetical protein
MRQLAALCGLAAAAAVEIPSFIDPILGCSRAPSSEQLESMRALLHSTTDEPGTPPDPIYGIWFLNWRLYQGWEIPSDSFGEGLVALLRPEDWNAASRTYSVRQRDFSSWNVNVNVAGTVNMAMFRTGFIESRDIEFGDDDDIVAITDKGNLVIPRSFMNHWRSTAINATVGTFDRTTGPDYVYQLSGGRYGYAGGEYEYTAYKLYGRGGEPFPANLEIYERYRWEGDVWKCP